MGIVADSLLDISRCILGSLRPLSGTQARVMARVQALSPGAVLLPGSFLAPIVGGALRHELLFRVAPRGPGENGRWSGSGLVELVSNLGGARHNLPLGTELRFDPAPAGFAPTAQVVEVRQLGLDPAAGTLGLKGGVVAESTPGLNTLDLWRSYLGGHFPAALVIWDSSDPADGLATSSLARGRSRAGEGSTFYAENWVVFLISSREDSEAMRRSDGLRLLQEASVLLTDVQSVDGLVFSNPSGVQIRRRSKPPIGDRNLAQQLQIYALEIATTNRIDRAEARFYSALSKFTADFEKYDPENGNKLVAELEGRFDEEA
jgi:hypothetical protein